MQTERLTIALTDGRTVEVVALGPPGAIPLVVHHGTPGGGLVDYQPRTSEAIPRGVPPGPPGGGLAAYQPRPPEAIRRALRVIHSARPGYSRSSPRPGR